MGRTGSNHESNRVKSWVEPGRIMSLTGSRVEQGRIMNRTRSNHESHKVATWVAQSRNIANLGRAKSQHESRKVATWVAQSLSNGIVVGFFLLA